MIDLVTQDSPLARVQGNTGIQVRASARTLSAEDEATLRQILEHKYDVILHPDFDLPARQAERRIFADAVEVPKPDTSWYSPVMDGYSDSSRTASSGSVLLTAKQEQALFIQYNYCRFRVNKLKDRLLKKPNSLDPKLVDQLLDWHFKAEVYRKQIADTNLALVLAMAKRARMGEADFAEMVSEGNMALLRAVDKFDAARGFKFSTYACRAILKAFSRNGIKLTKYRQMFPVDFDPKLERSNHSELKHEEHEQDCVDELKDILTDNRAELSDIEQQVITHRFAIGKPEDQQKPLTLEQVGKIIGVTKERVRQIQNKALVKMRETLETDFLR